jgi:hypothetical protein
LSELSTRITDPPVVVDIAVPVHLTCQTKDFLLPFEAYQGLEALLDHGLFGSEIAEAKGLCQQSIIDLDIGAQSR